MSSAHLYNEKRFNIAMHKLDLYNMTRSQKNTFLDLYDFEFEDP